METRLSYIVTGAIVIGLIVSAFLFVVWITKFNPQAQFQDYNMYFSSSAGLSIGSPVQYRGINIGEVKKIRINPDNVEQVEVTVKIDRSIPIKVDAIARIELLGITGTALIQIQGGTKEAPLLFAEDANELPVITTEPSEIQKVLEKGPEILTQILTLLTELREVLNEDNRTAIGDTLQNIRAASAGLSDPDNGLASLLKNVQDTNAKINSIVALVDDNKQEIVGTTVEGLQDLRASLREFQVAAKRINAISGDIQTFMKINEPAISDFTNSGLRELTVTISELKHLTENLSRVISKFEHDPARFLFGNQQEGVEVE